ncbi:MAG: sugar ABC transporter ATP-binding protein [Oscillospiraceae bacterium]|nr:sugar ABC transporter ATP-binding protein [Oscillospiraceae bacterium]
MSRTLLEFKNISKTYSGNQVLKDVSFDIREGEIHALLGENGAGKSTIMNILFGMPVIHSTGGFEGELHIDEKKVDVNSPFDAMALGIGMVHQEFMLIPGFTIAENVKLNREIEKNNIINTITSSLFGKRMKTLDRKAMNRDARKALDKLDMSIEEFTLVQGLPIGYMQFVEIAREIDKKGLKVLVLDEPTAVLTESEAEHLLSAMRNIAALGIAIVFISHRLNEITAVSDRVTILRDGEHVITKDTKDTNVLEIAEYMVGRKVSIDRTSGEGRQFDDNSDIALSVKDLYVAMPNEQVKGISFDVRKGEIFGIGGLAGQGKLGIANGLMGIYEAKGDILINGQKVALGKTRQMLGMGAAFVSEDRKGVGLLIEESIEDNIVFTAMNIHSEFLNALGLANKHTIREHARKMIKELDIRCTSEKQHTGRLSGGNQQKVCLARALTQKPSILFVSEPTRGIDIGAKKLILDLLLKLSREQGMTIIMTSSELAELCSISDRVAIVCEGEMVGILPPDASLSKFGLMMSGIKEAEGEVAS